MTEQTPREIQSAFEELADVVLGTPRSHFLGGGREEDGLVHKVDRIEAKLMNGGIRIKLPPAIWVALITTIGLILVAVIGLFSTHPSGG